MLELLAAEPGHRVLDVGAGSAWTTALLAHVVGPTGEVVGVERVPTLVAAARARGLTVHQAAPGVLGWPAGAPYDRILVSAGATDLPAALVGQLAPGGVMVIPVRGEMLRVIAADEGPVVERHGRYVFVPLVP
jgi:protein-L-isoaspartate(D-aspartate) O-methyltransferase